MDDDSLLEVSEEQQIDAAGKLHAAIIEYYRTVAPSAFIDDWVLVAHAQSVELTADGQSVINVVARPDMAFYRVSGLLWEALS